MSTRSTSSATRWAGSYLSDYADDTIPLSDCLGDSFCETAMAGFKAEVLRLVSGSGREVSQAYLMGQDGWNEAQAGVLDTIPVVLIGGNRFTTTHPANPAVWPNDGIVALQSSLAASVGDGVLPHRACFTFDDTHSIYVSDQAGLPWQTGLTWDPRVLELLRTSLDNAPNALSGPNRQGCP